MCMSECFIELCCLLLLGFFPLLGSDVEAPQISCPNDIEAKTGEQQDSANVTWQVPTAKDNSGEKVRLA
jgi:hypothetical protein